MPFENSSEQSRAKDVSLPTQRLQLLPSAGEYQTFGANALAQRTQASNDLVGSGVLTALQFNFNSQDTPVLIAQGPAEQTGKVIDYPSHKVGDQIKSGMNWVQSADARSASEKLQDFLGALGNNGTNPESHKQYIQGELDKLIGIGEGLHISKEQTKGAAAAGWKALNDGTVADFLTRPNAINEPMFKVVSTALDALSKDPEATNKALAALGTAIAESSEHYSALPHREKGRVIGQAMFNLFNPEGSTEAADVGLKIANNVTTHVDNAVVQAVGQQICAIEEIAKTAPEHARQAKQMLYEYLRGKGLIGPQLEYVGVPKGYFEGFQPSEKGGYQFNAMSQEDHRYLDRLPQRLRKTDKTAGILVADDGQEAEVLSGKIGPAQGMPAKSRGFDMLTKTHAEGHAVAFMIENGIKKATIFINNPVICGSCDRLIPRMLQPDNQLTVVLPNGARKVFTGEP